MKTKNFFSLFILPVIIFSQIVLAIGQSGGGYEIKRSVIASGGGTIQNGTFKINAIIGQGLAGTQMNGMSYSISNGFWGGGSAANVSRPPRFDFDGDGKADLGVFRPTEGNWYIQRSTLGYTALNFGLVNDRIVPADYDGDGKADMAVYRNGVWFSINSTNGALGGGSFGLANDIPVPGNFDGDAKDDLAVFRPSTGDWYVLNSSNGTYSVVHFGQNGDKPVIADYDGDGKADIAVFRPTDGNWHILRSALGYTAANFGASGDKPVTGDFDGDGKADLTIFRPSQGSWYSLRSTQGFVGVNFGLAGDVPAAADYDGDGKVDVSVYRAGVWYRMNSSNGQVQTVSFGLAADKPVPAAFIE